MSFLFLTVLLLLFPGHGDALLGPQRDVLLPGTLSYEMVFDWDNRQNTASAVYTEEIQLSRTLQWRRLQKTILSVSTEIKLQAEKSTKLKLSSTKISGSLGISTSYEKTEELETTGEASFSKTASKSFTCGANSWCRLYQLIYKADGYVERLDRTLLRTGENVTFDLVSPLPLICKVAPVLFLEKIDVVYSSRFSGRPQNSLAELHQSGQVSPDINYQFGGLYVWLVPTWTADPKKAVTEISVVIQNNPEPGMADLAKGAGGAFRYINLIRNPDQQMAISQVYLWRTYARGDEPNDPHTTDINEGRKKSFLYIAWKSEAKE